MSNYVPGGQKKVKSFKKRERELLQAISSHYADDKLYKLAQNLRDLKIQAIRVSDRPSNLSLENFLEKKELLIQKWQSYSVENIVTIYLNKHKAKATDEDDATE